MAKLHEILAIKSGITGKIAKLKADLMELFTKKTHHFSKVISNFVSVKEGIPDAKEQDTAMQTTVRKELAWFGSEFAKMVDLCHTINITNCEAKADVIIDGVVLLEKIPATGLLELEKLVTGFKELLTHVPTLDPVKGFKKDTAEGEGIYVAQPRMTARTMKEIYVLTLAAATDKHPAQASKETRDIITGHVNTHEWSGMLTPSEKSTILTRCEDLIMAIKSAQARANSTEAKSEKIGEKVVNHILA